MKPFRKTISFTIGEVPLNRILSWCNRFDPVIIYNSNARDQKSSDSYGSYNMLVCAGSIRNITGKNPFLEIRNFHTASDDWLAGYISYDVKNEIENLVSSNPDRSKFPDSFFFCPKYVFEFRNDRLIVNYHNSPGEEERINQLIDELRSETPQEKSSRPVEIIPRVSKEEYIRNVEAIKKHILRGDIYEMNYCIEFFAEDVEIDPPAVYEELNSISPMPFSVYMKTGNFNLMCASPERFLAKRNEKIVSQPIKGTARRGKGEEEDRAIAERLRNDPKEQSENVMIVDLVRNDLARTAAKGSVKVEELFGVKTYKQLHQMVSTITSELKHDVHFTEAIRDAFPMGSMTGAPKIRAMELIENFEVSRRGIFSGTVGYVTPRGDFDFNVVIRSIVYNWQNGYLSYTAGSAITASSDAEKEYEECMLKAQAMKQVLSS